MLRVPSPAPGAAVHGSDRTEQDRPHPQRKLTARLDRFELGVLVAFAAISMWVIAVDLWQIVGHGRIWTGTDGVYLADQLQYLAWVRDASQHFLISNLYVLRGTPHDFFQPTIVISGGLTAIGVPAWLSLLLWKPVAVVALFYAVRAYVTRILPGRDAARAAVVLALFFGSITIVYGSAGVIGDLFLGFLSWGYVFALLSIACLVAALLAQGRLRARNQIGWLPGALGALACLTHPWHGELLILTVIGAEAMLLTRKFHARRLGLAALTVGLTALPLLYYELLGRLDISWRLARVASKHTFALGSIVLVLVPLIIPALFARRPRSFLAASAPAWVIASLIVYAVSASGVAATPLHAFEGVTIPLAVLAVQGCQRIGWSRISHHRLAAVALIAALTVPALVDQLSGARDLVAYQPFRASFILRDERSALRYLADDPRPGGVMARSYLGAIVPGATGRHSFVGNCLWSEPHCTQRLVTVKSLFAGSLRAPAARQVVVGSGARFLLADCRPTANMRRLLGPVIASERRFGCARVYEVK